MYICTFTTALVHNSNIRMLFCASLVGHIHEATRAGDSCQAGILGILVNQRAMSAVS